MQAGAGEPAAGTADGDRCFILPHKGRCGQHAGNLGNAPRPAGAVGGRKAYGLDERRAFRNSHMAGMPNIAAIQGNRNRK